MKYCVPILRFNFIIMKIGMTFLAALTLASVGGLSVAGEPLFNGKDLSGWTTDVLKADGNPDIQPSFIVRDGKLVSLGRPTGYLISKKSYKNYKLTIEYRFSRNAGDCGVLVHVSKLRYLYRSVPKSIEVQMLSGHAGDFWCVGENIEVPDMEKRRPRNEGQAFGGGAKDARHIFNLTDDSEKKLGEWNTMVIECRGSSIKVWVNGELVNHGTNATASQGKIAIQAEGTEVEFRKLEMEPLTEPLATSEQSTSEQKK